MTAPIMSVVFGFRMLQIHGDCSDAPVVPAADSGQVKGIKTVFSENSIIIRGSG
jgi:hypothetical protein